LGNLVPYNGDVLFLGFCQVRIKGGNFFILAVLGLPHVPDVLDQRLFLLVQGLLQMAQGVHDKPPFFVYYLRLGLRIFYQEKGQGCRKARCVV
jgi:hypothetical protein